MIAEIGHYALVLALVLALVQATVPLIGAERGNASLMALGRSVAAGQLVFVAVAFASLMAAYMLSDFSIENVARNSHSAKPMLYKIAGVWGNHEGSMVLWVLILALFGGLVAAFGVNLPPGLRARVLAVQGMIGAAFLLFILFTSNPFLRLDPVPADGNGLNPILQDPGLAFHPPFLYLGYVGFSVAFAFAVAALIEGRVDAAWGRWVRPWTLAAWCSLSLGIGLGSWWAYYELGWGGFWFWDPVENASFMPWLAGTALLHSAIVVERREALKSWTILLAILTFVLSLVGTFLVRSGVLTSVHSFATDPTRGLFILAIVIAAAGGALVLYAIRAPDLKGGGLFAPISREGALVLNNLLLITATATVFLGTLYPMLLELIGGGKVSVGAPYFNATFLPLMLPVIAAMAIGPMLAWKRGDAAAVWSRLRFAFAVALAAALAAWYLQGGPVLALVGLAIAAWLIAGTMVGLADRIKLFRAPLKVSLVRLVHLPRATIGMTVAHLAMGLTVSGITLASAWQAEKILIMAPGQSVVIAGYDVVYGGVREVMGPNYRAQRGTLTVSRGGKLVTVLRPEKRRYPVEGSSTTEAAIHTTWFADIYGVLGDTHEDGRATIRLYHNPGVPWIWIGVVFMALGGGISLSDRRHRIGAPVRAKPRAGEPPGDASAGDASEGAVA